jgi:hypothetical protein
MFILKQKKKIKILIKAVKIENKKRFSFNKYLYNSSLKK